MDPVSISVLGNSTQASMLLLLGAKRLSGVDIDTGDPDDVEWMFENMDMSARLSMLPCSSVFGIPSEEVWPS